MKQELFSIESTSIKIKENTILNSVYVQLFAGETTAIIFNNSDEKNAFIDFLAGKLPMYSGRVHIDDKLIHKLDIPHKMKEALYVIKNPTLLNKQLRIWENLYFSSFNKLYIQKKLYLQKTVNLLMEFGLDIDPNTPIHKLTPFQCTIIEVLKAYVTNHHVIVFANVTGALDNIETKTMIDVMRYLKSLGLSFLIIGAFEEILFAHTDAISIIQNGRTIGVFNSSEFTIGTLHKLLAKYSLSLKEQQELTVNEKIFAMHHVYGHILKDVNFSLRRGDILKILYSDDESAKELESILKGGKKDFSGNIYLHYTLYQARTIKEALKLGVGFIEENPLETMLFKNLPIIDNVCYPLSNRIHSFWLRRKYLKSVMGVLDPLINSAYYKKSISEVSAETLYLIIYCKWLLFMPKVLVCINPFSVTDYQTNQIIRQMIEYLSARGISVIIITSYWPSLCTIKGTLKYLEGGYLKTQDT